MSKDLIVVNADDFGESSSVNQAIFECSRKDLISSATLICNLPGFEEACEMVKSEKLDGKIGIHFNLSEGEPLTEEINKQRKFINNDGHMYESFKGFTLNHKEKVAIYKELKAQLERCVHHGIIPTHIDSHHHMHHSIGIGRVVLRIAREFNIHAVRLRFNYGDLSYSRKLYSFLYNSMIKYSKKSLVDYFCEIRSVNDVLLGKNARLEVMVHPVLDQNGNLRNYENGEELIPLINHHLPDKEFVTYKELNYLK